MDEGSRVRLCHLAVIVLALSAGCVRTQPHPHPQAVAALLPAEVRLHPFSGTRQFEEAEGVNGIEARVEAIDHFGDATKALGRFRFEAHHYRPHQPDRKGALIAPWVIDLTDPQTNLRHWDSLSRTYRFHLQWTRPVPPGERFVLRVVFSPPEGARLFDELVLVSGQ